MKLLLASRSETRARILEAAAISFEPVSAPFDEERSKSELLKSGLSPLELADQLAERKALSVGAPSGSIVLGADQVLETGQGGLLSKPCSREEARQQLLSLRATTHRLHSSAVLVRDGRRIWGASESCVLRMRAFGPDFLETYLDSEYEKVRWNVGAYRIEGPGIQLFESIQGSHFAILGLPLLPLLAALREFGLAAQ